MAVDHYLRAQKKGMKLTHALQAKGEDTALPVLSEIVPELNRLTQIPLGLVQISLDQVEGTATRGRTTAFARNFMPLLDSTSEFAYKWHTLYDDVIMNGLRDPIIAYEYYNRFYVVEGNKRVSVMRTLDAVSIEANVTRVLPEPEDSVRYRVYQEFLRFYADCRINFIHFTSEGSYDRFYALLGKNPGDAWTPDEITDLQSCYHRFSQAYDGPKKPLPVGDAFLKYLDVCGYTESVSNTPAEFRQKIGKIWPEFIVAAAGKPAALLNQPAEKQQTLLNSMLRRTPNPLRCAFVYNHSPLEGGWTYSHELGRKALENTFGSRIETTTRENVTPQEASRVIDELAREGYHVIFTASPVLLDACVKQSIAHPEVKILNCSLLASYHNVRSYYLRIFEAKFILGAIAGAMSDNNLIGYIADYPIYGVPASINAFALGAQMTNPRAKVYLKWSSLLDANPEKELSASGVCIISNRDISAPRMESRAFGLYHELDGNIHNLAMPIWNWEKVYQGIARSILSGAWEEDASSNADRALSYFMGMSTDAIDLLCSKRVPPRVRRLVDLLHERIRAGAFLPFVGPIVDQAGEVRVAEDVALTPEEIIRMDYLAQNVVGRIPEINELTDVTKALVSMQGVRAANPGEGKSPNGDPV
ncbi:MAG: BMP family ABC transporter substrate-binding protein [Clostridiales bacterium]|nr:BMP family ABC transporter substrate-binding protein [Clostridiales bacterium]